MERIEKWYENVGKKLKNLAKWCFIVEAIAAILSGLGTLASDEDMILVGLLIIVVGPIVAFVGSWMLYGFGEIVDKVCEIAKNTAKELPQE